MKKQKNSSSNEERRLNLEREHLIRETGMGIRNNERLRFFWMKVMTKLKIPVMKEEIAITRNSFDSTLDIKDYKVSSLMESLDKAGEQYDRNIGGHAEAIGRFERIYNDRMNNGHTRYEEKLSEIIEEAEITNATMKSVNDESEAFLRSLMMRGMRTIDQLLEKIQSEGAYKLDNLHEDGSQSTKMALVDLEIKIKFYWNFLDSVISKYLNDTRHRRMSYEILKVKDMKDREVIKNQSIEINEFFESIHRYKKKIEGMRKKAIDTASNIHFEKTLSLSAYSTAKERFHHEQVIDKRQLSYMIKQFKLTSKNLQRLVKKAEFILSFRRICRKFESKVDKQLSIRRNEGRNRMVNEDEFGCFEFFWYRVCKTQLDTITLKNHRERLYQEKDYLETYIKRRIIGDSFENSHDEFSSVLRF